ncbi:MAG: hypothetical protein RBQ84_03510 [Arcobacter sp.]|jgi:O-antigen/teichoic acid export membrane protein|uniref:hypothetical protein n=1 Tax=Arcobacter sp. TaxID=1872629 RepID=UPI002A765C85|nr:hypothetical protein [Arcobacter sp.]MDY3199996.1 hypothetical protein [Arcobacter sp.]
MKKNLSLLFLANIIKGFYQWSLLILTVKFLSTEDVGYFTLAFAVSAPIFMFFNLQLKSIYVVDHRRTTYDFNYFVIRIVTIILALICLIIYSYFNNYNLLVLLLVGLIKALESLFDIVHADFQKKELMKYMSISIISQSIISFFTFTVVLYFSNSLVYSLVSVAFLLLMVFLLYDLQVFLKLNHINFKYIKFIKISYLKQNNLHFIKRLLLNALPLGISVFIGSYLTNLPRIYVEKYLGIEQLAYFGAMSYMAIGFFQLLLPIQIILRPRLAKLLKENKWKEFTKYLNLSIFVTVIFGSLLVFNFYIFGDYILIKVYNENYTSYLNILLLLMLGQIILTSSGYLNIAVQSFHIFKIQLLISVFLLFIVLLLGPILINTMGINGAAYLTLLYAFLSFISYFTIFIWEKPC